MSIEIILPGGVGEKSHYQFDASQGRITFGRDGANCDVVFAAEQDLVSRQHFALDRKFDGVYEVDLRDGRYVEIDGKPAREGQAISGRHKVVLGNKKGPSFELVIEQDDVSDKTAAQQAMPDIAKTAQRNSVIGLIALMLVVVVGGAFAYFYTKSQSAFSTATLERVRAATMLAANENKKTGAVSQVGTAWVVGEGVLATNAHVAHPMNQGPDADTKPVVIDQNGTRYEIAEIRIHPGYDAFADEVMEARLATENAVSGAALQLIPGYDVALLYTADTAPPLPEALEIAASAEFADLSVGTKLGSIGFPSEKIAGGAALTISPQSQTRFGNLTNQSTFFFLKGDEKYRQLVTHTVGATGGASGSPIFDEDGTVVAVMSAVNMIATSQGRAPSGAMINYGMRIDLVADLLAEVEATRLPEYRAHWDEQKESFTTVHAIRGSLLEQAWAKDNKITGTPERLVDKEVVLSAQSMLSGSLGSLHVVDNIPAGVPYLFYAVSEDEYDIDAFVLDSKNQVLGLDENRDPTPSLRAKMFGPVDRLQFLVRGPKNMSKIPEGKEIKVLVRILKAPAQ